MTYLRLRPLPGYLVVVGAPPSLSQFLWGYAAPVPLLHVQVDLENPLDRYLEPERLLDISCLDLEVSVRLTSALLSGEAERPGQGCAL